MIVLVAACFRSEVTEFPPGLEPLAPNAAVFPAEVDGELPEVADVVVGTDDTFDWANLRGYVRAPLASVWAGVQEPDTCVDRRAVDAWTTDSGVEDGYDVSFVVHTHVVDLVTIDYDLTWRQSAVGDDVVAVRWQKTEGAAIVELLEGSIALTAVEEEVTAVEIVEHLATTGDQSERLTAFFDDLWASVVARAHGEPLPVWE